MQGRPNKQAKAQKPLFVSALFIAVLAIGAVHVPIILGVCAFLVLSAVLWSREATRQKIQLDLVLIAMLALLAMTIFQTIPLSEGLLSFVAPRVSEIFHRSTAVAGLEGAWGAMSLLPSATILEVVKLSAVILAYLLATLWTQDEGHRLLLMVVALVGVSTAVVALFHRLGGLEAAYGLYTPVETAGAYRSAPLINANHLAGVMVLCAPVSLGLALDTLDRTRRSLWFVAAFLMGTVALLTLSRGGIACLILASAIFAVNVLRRRSHRRSTGRRERLWIVLSLLVLFSGGAFVAHQSIVSEFVDGGANKLELWRSVVPMVVAFLPFGVGRGAFRDAFTAFDGGLGDRTFSHAESFLLQWPAEWGVVGVCAALALVALALVLSLRTSHRKSVVGAAAGVVGAIVHNAADFSLELLGPALLFSVTLAVVLRATKRRRDRISTPRVGARPAVVVASATLVLAVVVFTLSVDDAFASDETRLRELVASNDTEFRPNLARAYVHRHPSDYLIFNLVGAWELRSRAGSGLRWFGRSLALNPDCGETSLWIARSLASAGRLAQAGLEYRTAAARAPRLVERIAREMVLVSSSSEDLSSMIRGEPTSLDLLNGLSLELSRAGRSADAVVVDELLLEAAPTHRLALTRAARRALSAGRIEEARALTGRLDGDDPLAVALLADADAREGNYREAIARIERALAHEPDHRRLLAELARHHESAGDIEGARAAFERLERAVGRRGLSSVLVSRAKMEERAGFDAISLRLYQRAVALGAGRPALMGVARLAEKTGDTHRALRARQRLAEEMGGEQEAGAGLLNVVGSRNARATRGENR